MTDTDNTGSTEATFHLKDLLLDATNPRFGTHDGRLNEQSDILDFIVERFGVDDVLSSLSVNGYFSAEPLVCRAVPGNNTKAVVAEGNRRLAACLILSGDARASRHTKRTEDFRAIWLENGEKPFDPVPVILFPPEKSNSLLSYLGVRHIAASQPWDSYAKAAWVAQVVDQNNVSLSDVSRMIGDQHRTIARLLEGYYFVRQSIDAGRFRPADSVRRGRGSVTEYPFSWVYTILGYTNVRRFLGLREEETHRDPVPAEYIDRSGILLSAMFGDRSRGRSAAISDSRQLGDLATVFSSSEKVAFLEAGRTVEDIERITQPIADRLRRGLADIRMLQTDLLAGLAEQHVPADVAEPLVEQALRNRRSAADIEKRLRVAVEGDLDD